MSDNPASPALMLAVEIDRCDRKIVEMLGRRATAVKQLARHNQMTVRKPHVYDNYPLQMSKLPNVAESYNAPLCVVDPIFKQLYRTFETYEIFGEPRDGV